MQDTNHIHSAMMLEWLGQAPVTIHRAFIDLTGNVLAALWLSYALERAPGQDQVGSVLVEMTSAECLKNTGITRAQQQTCRKVLVDLGILTEEGDKGRALQYRINTQRLMDLLIKQAQPLADAMQLASHQLAGWAAAGLVDTDLRFSSFFKLYWTDVPKRRVPTPRVVEPLDIVKHI